MTPELDKYTTYRRLQDPHRIWFYKLGAHVASLTIPRVCRNIVSKNSQSFQNSHRSLFWCFFSYVNFMLIFQDKAYKYTFWSSSPRTSLSIWSNRPESNPSKVIKLKLRLNGGAVSFSVINLIISLIVPSRQGHRFLRCSCKFLASIDALKLLMQHFIFSKTYYVRSFRWGAKRIFCKNTNIFYEGDNDCHRKTLDESPGASW